MDRITYVDVPARHEIRVFIGKRRVGTIVTLANVLGQEKGFQYRPKGSTHLMGCKVFETVEACKQSLA